MAKKTKTTTVEEVEEAPEAPIDYKKDIENKSFEQVAEPAKEEAKEPEKPAEEETETVEFDPEQLKREAVEQAKAELADVLKGGTKEENAEVKDEYQEYQKEFFAKNNRQPTWFEVAKFTEEQLEKKQEAKEAQRAKQQEEEKAKEKETIDKNNEATNKYVEDTLNELYENEKLPKIQDPKNEDDYGLRVQKALLAKVVEVNTQRINDKQTPKTIKEILYEDFKIPDKEVAGADAPTNMGRGGYTPDDTEEINYVKDIAGPRNSIRNILNRAIKR
jgi:hypothetical protein